MSKPLNIHQVMQKAVVKTQEDRKVLTTQTFKISEDEKIAVQTICENNGTTVSKFYQECAKTLISDHCS